MDGNEGVKLAITSGKADYRQLLNFSGEKA
jgi:hypothetical protein